MATIRDIAQLAGCSVTTVSRVLNNHPYVADEKREQILAIIEELDYIPNAQARDLSNGLSKNIGVLIPYANVPHYEKLISGILNAAFRADYRITLLPTNYDTTKEEFYLKQLAAKAYDGLIITSKSISFDVIQGYLKYGPIVCCEDTGSYPISYVSFQREQSYIEVFEHFKQHGLATIGLALGRDRSVSPSSRIVLSAYEECFGQAPATALLYYGCRSYEDGLKAGTYFSTLANAQAIFANGDDVAAGIIKGLPATRKMEVIGEENLISSQLLGFSTVDHHLEQCGAEAFELLFKDQNSRTTIPYQFIKRS